VPGTYTGPVSFRIAGQNFIDTPASGPVVIGAHASATIPLDVAFPAAPGDHPESVQFAASDGARTSLPVTRRTLIPANGGRIRTLITSTVGRAVGQVSTYEINVPAGRTALTANFRTADASADNNYTFYLINPSGTVISTDTTPKIVNGAPVATASVTTADPAAGTWQIDVELNLTTSGKEFSQTVYGDVLDPRSARFTTDHPSLSCCAQPVGHWGAGRVEIARVPHWRSVRAAATLADSIPTLSVRTPVEPSWKDLSRLSETVAGGAWRNQTLGTRPKREGPEQSRSGPFLWAVEDLNL
jgi:hypothetical protein